MRKVDQLARLSALVLVLLVFACDQTVPITPESNSALQAEKKGRGTEVNPKTGVQVPAPRKPPSVSKSARPLATAERSKASKSPEVLKAGSSPWRRVAQGVRYRAFEGFGDSDVADRRLHVVRIDPKQTRPVAMSVSQSGSQPQTAADWCAQEKLAVAINAGMYHTDFKTHVGHFRIGEHVNSAKWVGKYRSVLIFGPRDGAKKEYEVAIVDLDGADNAVTAASHQTVVQNLRLIKGPGRGVWKPQPKRWSEAAVAIDSRGRLLFLFSRSPYSMYEFNRQLLALPLDIVKAQHVEGGPEASLSVHGGGVNLDLGGSFETGFNENDDEKAQWPIPSIIGAPSD